MLHHIVLDTMYMQDFAYSAPHQTDAHPSSYLFSTCIQLHEGMNNWLLLQSGGPSRLDQDQSRRPAPPNPKEEKGLVKRSCFHKFQWNANDIDHSQVTHFVAVCEYIYSTLVDIALVVLDHDTRWQRGRKQPVFAQLLVSITFYVPTSCSLRNLLPLYLVHVHSQVVV